jgi:type I restriction enzyme S subunit
MSRPRDGWIRVRFGEIAQHVAERVEPSPDDGKLYVGLEHLDSGSLTVRRWGSETDLIGTKLQMQKGDILFARRNAYLRRVAIAPHTGLFSAHGMVLRPKHESIAPRFLPFFMQSDQFMDRAEKISVGSLSPTINWSALREQEFDLPPIDQQEVFADLLTASWVASDAAATVAARSAELADAAAHSLFEESSAVRSAWPSLRVDDVCRRVSVGIVIQPAKLYVPEGIRCFRSANVRRGYVQDDDWVFISPFSHQAHDKSALNAGDVLVVRTGANVGMCCVVPEHFAGANCIDIVFATPLREKLLPEWLELFVNSSAGRAQILRDGQGLAQKHFGVAAFKEMQLPIPPLDVQEHYVRLVEATRSAATAARDRAGSHAALLRSVLN